MKIKLVVAFVLASAFLWGQEASEFEEMENPVATDISLWKSESSIKIGWGSTDIRYPKQLPVTNLQPKLELYAWRGERIAGQWVISNPKDDISVSFEVPALKHAHNKRQQIQHSPRHTGFVRYVMTDELNKNKKGACGRRKSQDFDSLLVADAIDHHAKTLLVQKQTSRAVWVSFFIPQTAASGVYTGEIIIKKNEKKIKKLPITIKVSEKTLPPVADFQFHLDLWQNPYAVARYHRVDLWSDNHFKLLEKEFKRYAQAGGKVITATLIDKPWNAQTYDPFGSMVTWVKRIDGSWWFDFTIFDKWVELMQRLGVTQQINCYSMLPWELNFPYYDQATQSVKSFKAKPSDPIYQQIWGKFLKDFASHLREKGLMNITHIAMDERPIGVMLQVQEIIKKADKDFKIALAGALHPQLIDLLDDYCVALRMKFTPEMLARRKAGNKLTTYYTSCEEPRPNTFTFSPPAESEWLGWYAAKADLDGYLRWALNSWGQDPLRDSRFRSWGAGDTYLVYPNDRTSVRFERLFFGIQAYEKIQILKREFNSKGNRVALQRLNALLTPFDEQQLHTTSAAQIIEKAKKDLEELSEITP